MPELTERLERAAHRTRAFPLRLRGGGHFGGRALWAGAAGGIAELRRLAERADAAARRTGLAMEEHRTYRPHLTLARTRTETDLRPYAAALDGFEGTPWEVGELALVRAGCPWPECRGSSRGTRRWCAAPPRGPPSAAVNLDAWTPKPGTGSWPPRWC